MHSAWRARGGEAILESERARFKALREGAEYAAKKRRQVNDWRRRNPAKVAAQRSRALPSHAANEKHRQARKTRQTPPWADRDAMKAFYVEAARITAETGVEHHVDHVFPLKGKSVSGLHVQTNLQVLEALANISKGNRLIEDSSA